MNNVNGENKKEREKDKRKGEIGDRLSVSVRSNVWGLADKAKTLVGFTKISLLRGDTKALKL